MRMKTKKTSPAPSDFFKKKAESMEPAYNIGAIFGHRTVKGDIGIEVEVEGNKFPKTRAGGWHADVDRDRIPKEWKYTHDGSLRGEDNAEYVFKQPLKFDDVGGALDNLWKMFDDYGSKLDESNRTSVHVHLNAQGWHLNRLTSFLALFFSVEDLLTQWCGDHRVGNMFCLRSKDATNIVAQIRDFIASDGRDTPSQGMHYAGINCHALTKFGSVEIRTLRGTTEVETVKTWVNILRRIYEMSAEYDDPRGVVEGFSGAGPMQFLQNVLGPYTADVVEGSGLDNQTIMASMYEGVRLAQDLCYCRDWSRYKPEQVKTDPFGRVKKKNTAAFANVYGDAPQPAGSTITMTPAEFEDMIGDWND